MSREEAEVYAEGVRRGGTLVSAKVKDELRAAAEMAIDRLPYVDTKVRGAAYREEGWTRFDDDAPLYSNDEILAERARRGVL